VRKTLELLAVVSVVVVTAGCGGGASSEQMPGDARALAVAPDFAGTLWAALGPNAYRTQDGGRSWTRVASAREGDGVAFTEKYTYLVGPSGGEIADFGGSRAAPFGRTPATFVAVASPYHKTNRLYALDGDGGLWLSVNAGRRWSKLRADGLPDGCVNVSAVRDEVTEPDILYVACGPDGLWHSGDLGASFQKVEGIGDARSVAMTTDDQNLVLVAAGDGIYRSTNRGKTFQRTSDAVASAVAFDPRNRRLAYAASDGRLLRSTDGGANWPGV
jgi:photosystem II stability/assembly factor-like uncharacterized protein